ncbi:hypothetical protein [Demequina litorisediminis]|nr:hypothetical protein [Demequina litorisediminis]
MVREALTWSGLEVTAAVARFVEQYVFFLEWVEADPATVQEWLAATRDFGVIIVRDD